MATERPPIERRPLHAGVRMVVKPQQASEWQPSKKAGKPIKKLLKRAKKQK
jgi:hypothetical protein